MGCMILLFSVNLFSQSFGPNPPIDSSDRNKSYQKVTKYTPYNDLLTEMIDADNTAIQYSGKIDFSNKNAPQFSHAGVSVKTLFEGTGIDIILEDSGFKDYCLIFIDKRAPLLIHLKRGKHTYTIARNLSNGFHSIKIFKRSEANCGMITFFGLALESEKGIHSPAHYTRNLFFIGDSITAGYGNDRDITGLPESGFDSFYQNHYNAYGAIAARNMNSNYQTVCYSGIGVVRGSSGDTRYNMPDFYRQINYGSKTRWNPNDYIPDVIVINLGTNDYNSENDYRILDDKLFQETYTRFVQEIRDDYPNAQIICAVGCMITNDWPPGKRAKNRLRKTVLKMVKQFNKSGDAKVHYMELTVSQPSNGDNYHPNTPNHIEMAKSVEILCRKIMGW